MAAALASSWGCRPSFTTLLPPTKTSVMCGVIPPKTNVSRMRSPSLPANSGSSSFTATMSARKPEANTPEHRPSAAAPPWAARSWSVRPTDGLASSERMARRRKVSRWALSRSRSSSHGLRQTLLSVPMPNMPWRGQTWRRERRRRPGWPRSMGRGRFRAGVDDLGDFVGRAMCGMDHAPMCINRHIAQQPGKRALARPGQAIGHLFFLLCDVHVNWAIGQSQAWKRLQDQANRSRQGRTQRMRRETESDLWRPSIMLEQRLEHFQEIVWSSNESPLSRRWRAPPKSEVS